jgi:hypothetical protein
MDTGIPDPLLIAIGVLLGGPFIVAGVLVRTGKLRAWVPLYEDATLTRSLRHGAFSLIPTGLAILCVTLAGALIDETGWVAGVGIIALLIALVSVIASFRIIGRAPVWSKPPWLVAEERDARRSGENAPTTKEGT